MFTFLVRLWLLMISSGLIALALQHAYVTLRDGRKQRRQLAAHYYAQHVIADRLLSGELNVSSREDIEQAYHFEKIAYLNQ